MAICYEGESAQYHQAQVDQLDPNRWRLVVLNVDGDRAGPRYSAVWVERAGPAWLTRHEVAEADYQQVVAGMDERRYQPVLVTASGGPGQAVFAAVFAQDQPRTYARHGLRLGAEDEADTLQNAMRTTRDTGFVPHSIAIYGDWFDPRFAAVWTFDPGRSWSWWWGPLDDYQGAFTAMLHSGLLPRQVSVTGFHRLAVFTDDHLGPWSAAHDLAEADYHQAVEARKPLRPIAAQAGMRRYAATFAADDLPYRKDFRVEGPSIPDAAELDDAIRSFMAGYRIRAASIAVAKAGTPHLTRAYTLAEADHPTTTVRTSFRVASVSKLFTTAAIQVLADDGAFGPRGVQTPVFGYLGMNPALPHDPVADTITLQQCAEALSGMVRDFEPGVRFRDVSVGLGRRQATILDLATYIYQIPLAYTPGMKQNPTPGNADPNYSNAAFHVLGAVVERASGRSLVDFVNERLARPMGIRDLAAGRTAWDQRLPGEVVGYEDVGIGVSQLDLMNETPEANQYGGDILLDSAPGSGGLVTSPISVARFIGSHNAYGLGRRPASARRYGTFAGTSAAASSEGSDWDLAFATNREISDDTKTALLDIITAYFAGRTLTPFDVDEEFPVRGVLLAGGFRTQHELNAMTYEEMRNTLIVELTHRTADSNYQSYDNASLAGAGAALVFFRRTAIRSDAELRAMTADGLRNTFIVEVDAVTGVGQALQGFSTLQLALIALGSDLAVRGRVPGSVSSWLRGVLLLGGFRTQRELNQMDHDAMRNTLIVELTNRTAPANHQALSDGELEAAGALLVLLRTIKARDDATLRTMSIDDLRNVVIVELDAQTRLGPLLQGFTNLELVQTALGCRPYVA